MLHILGTVPGTRDLVTFSKFSKSMTDNQCKSGPALTLVILGVLIILSAWAIINILLAPPNPGREQAGDQMLAQPENQRYDQRPMMFAMGFVMLLLLFLLLLEPELAYRLKLFLRLAGSIYMGLWARYLNPETMTCHYWIVYLLGSSGGSTLFLIHHTGWNHTGCLEIFLFLNFGLSTLFMKPLIILSQWLNQSNQQDGQQLRGVSEPGQISQGPPPNEPPENNRARTNVQSGSKKAQRSSKFTREYSSGVRAAQKRKYRGWLQSFIT